MAKLYPEWGILDRIIEDLPKRMLAEFLKEKLKGVKKLTNQERMKIAGAILDGKKSFSISVKGKKPKHVDLEFTEDDVQKIDKAITKFVEDLRKKLPDLMDGNAISLYKKLKRTWPKENRLAQKEVVGFRGRLNKRWGQALGMMRMQLTMSRELTQDSLKFLSTYESPLLAEVVARKLARGCQIMDEIITLLSSGFPNGAMARWRTLHEISTVLYLLVKHGETLVIRYRDHEAVENYKGAEQYNKYAKKLGENPLSTREMKSLEAEYKRVITKYGKDFARQYGWASSHMKSNTFAEVQESAGIEFYGPYYRVASHDVHANPKGIFYRIGSLADRGDVLSGATNDAIGEPGQYASIALLQLMSNLISLNPTFENVVIGKTMQHLVDDIKLAFNNAQEKLIQDEIEIRKQEAQKHGAGGED